VDNFFTFLWINFYFKGICASKGKKQPFLVDNFSYLKKFRQRNSFFDGGKVPLNTLEKENFKHKLSKKSEKSTFYPQTNVYL